MIGELGKLLEDIGTLREYITIQERRMKYAYWYGNITTTIPGVIFIINGISKNSVELIKTGILMEIGMHIIYQGGHWIFRVW